MSYSLSTPKPTNLTISSSIVNCTSPVAILALHFPISSNSKRIRPPIRLRFSPTVVRSQSPSNPQSRSKEEEDDAEAQVQDLRVPDHWLLPSKALQESEWLRVTLHKWLDDEYCPEDTNVEISKVAAQSYYESLVGKRTDLGEILLTMARKLESISYQESFHGAFSSANAAVNLIAQRIELQGKSL
ncbi:hypothetical protein JCGZ_13848 [Jatropha curcas]|uniref:Uncharacterized protein n=1 Tax=Jatropha curcas TaxID=180498 RepID=A0A067JW05_JATCU|nr:uncharacterized protein LOC105642442 [Jatropha curcas]KDP28077.1 hypothetical protein JCGZ_13848 [Jatropha curcas]